MNYDSLKFAFEVRLKNDKTISRILQKIAGGKADFTDTAQLSEQMSNILGIVLPENIFEIDYPPGREGACSQLLHDYYDEINDVLAKVQRSADEKKGLRINPQKADFPEARVEKFSHSLADPTVPDEVIERRAGSASTIAKSFHDDYMKKNAQFRNDAGLKCRIVRETDGNCCAWCSSLAGRYVYGEHPDDIFRRHDNCGCIVTFECGRTRQNVWTKRSWEAPDTPSDPVKPAVISPEKAKALQEKNLPETLTNRDNDGIIESRLISGALNPESLRAQEHADRYYESVRHMKTDVKRISDNTGFSENDIDQIKNHVFMQKHDLGNDELEYFYPNYEMAESWQRLIDGSNIQPHDITLLHHEKMEHELMKAGYSQEEAHRITETKYNYKKESKEYYAEINKHKT